MTYCTAPPQKIEQSNPCKIVMNRFSILLRTTFPCPCLPFVAWDSEDGTSPQAVAMTCHVGWVSRGRRCTKGTRCITKKGWESPSCHMSGDRMDHDGSTLEDSYGFSAFTLIWAMINDSRFAQGPPNPSALLKKNASCLRIQIDCGTAAINLQQNNCVDWELCEGILR